MTPAKEKAKELYDKYEKIFIDANADSWGKEAKQSALIAVEEIINAITLIENDFHEGYFSSDKDYYKQVKNEINAL